MTTHEEVKTADHFLLVNLFSNFGKSYLGKKNDYLDRTYFTIQLTGLPY